MKKVKVMLSAIAVLAIVGGALAFKAKSMSGQILCYRVDAASTTCNLVGDQSTTEAGADIYWTTVNNINECQNGTTCLSLAETVKFGE